MEEKARMKKGICLTALYPQAMENAELLLELFEKVSGSDEADDTLLLS